MKVLIFCFNLPVVKYVTENLMKLQANEIKSLNIFH